MRFPAITTEAHVVTLVPTCMIEVVLRPDFPLWAFTKVVESFSLPAPFCRRSVRDLNPCLVRLLEEVWISLSLSRPRPPPFEPMPEPEEPKL